jgi:hypothetical protein
MFGLICIFSNCPLLMMSPFLGCHLMAFWGIMLSDFWLYKKWARVFLFQTVIFSADKNQSRVSWSIILLLTD